MNASFQHLAADLSEISVVTCNSWNGHKTDIKHQGETARQLLCSRVPSEPYSAFLK